jgi:NADH:ubiquinone oxidoreductase subunit B-like Fe-S oxidoreductase
MGFGTHGQHTSGKQGVEEEETKKNNNGPESAERDKKMRFFREQITFFFSLFLSCCGVEIDIV